MAISWLFEPLLRRAWLLLLQLGAWWHPIHVQHRWTGTSASLLLRRPQAPLWAETVPGSLLPPFLAPAPPVSLRLMQITDAHVTLAPLSGPSEKKHGKRMHDAFHGGSRCLWNDSNVEPAAMLRELIDVAATAGVDVVALSGDIVSLPQESAVSWAAGLLESNLWYRQGPSAKQRIPYVFTAGNHDWFFEGSNGSQRELQQEWRQKALRPFYASSAGWGLDSDGNYDYSSFEAGGMLVLTVDNSRYQVSWEQLAFFRRQLLRWLPTVLVVHVPLSVADSLRPHGNFVLCGDPAWGEATDRSWQHESRDPWPKEGNERSTELFLEAVLAAAAPNGPLVAVLAGHTHGHDATPFGGGNIEEEQPNTMFGGGGSSAQGAVQYISHPSLNGGHRFFDVESAPQESAGAEHDSSFNSQGMADALGAQLSARDFVTGLTWAALQGKVSPDDQMDIELDSVWHCWGGLAGLNLAAAKLDPALVAQGIAAMLRRTEEAVRHGFLILAQSLQPLIAGAEASEGPAMGREETSNDAPACQEAGGMLQKLMKLALPLWADPPMLIYAPGKQLEVKVGCSMIEALNQAIRPWKQHGDWTALGFGIGAVMQATSCHGNS